MKKKIEVTAKDISNGICGHNSSCPIALAFKRTLEGAEVEVNYRFDSIIGEWIPVPLPVRAIRFIKAFDHEKPVKPFSFYINVP